MIEGIFNMYFNDYKKAHHSNNTNKFSLINSFIVIVRSFLSLSLCLVIACGGSESTMEESAPVLASADLVKFSFLKAYNPDLDEDVHLSISGNQITGRIKTNISVEGLVATFGHDGSEVLVNNIVQVNSSSVNDFTDIVTYSIKSSDGIINDFQIDLTKFTGLPIIYLSTDDNAPIDSKDEYVNGNVTLDGGRYNESVSQIEMKIRGRGNSTWGLHPKKPFQMKLDDKMEFLGMPSDKKWLFLAEYSDKTMLRNTIAFEMGHISHLDWTPESTFAEVYINETYNGTYNITQKVEESDNRVALGDTGYLLEIDQLERLD
ncbi:MAG: CotH kinase family protein, partial [Kangiellaceae bacterium]